MGIKTDTCYHRDGVLPVILDDICSNTCGTRLCFLISILSHLQTPILSSLLTIKLLEEPNCKVGSKHLGKEWETKKLAEERRRRDFRETVHSRVC